LVYLLFHCCNAKETFHHGTRKTFLRGRPLFNFVSGKGEEWSLLGAARTAIVSFCEAAKASGWRVKCFIDAATGDAPNELDDSETLAKWKAKRLGDVTKGTRLYLKQVTCCWEMRSEL
jgi:hypothetical protein